MRILSAQGKKTPLVTNYAGSWTLPGTYLDAWADTNNAAGLAGAYKPPVQAETLRIFKQVVESCALTGQKNPCLDRTYKDNTLAEEAFAKGEAHGFMGYTERLFYILSANKELRLSEIKVIAAPLGKGSHSVMKVDASDRTFATSSGMLVHGGTPVTSMPYGVAFSCDERDSGLGRIDLRDTPFKLAPKAFVTAGSNPQGSATYSDNDQVVSLKGGGYCGWINQGLLLELRYEAR